MRQSTLSFLPGVPVCSSVQDALDHLMTYLNHEENVSFIAVFPHGNVLKSVGELLYRCSQLVPLIADGDGLQLSSCDQTSGRLIRVELSRGDMLRYSLLRPEGLRITLDANSLHATFHQLKRRDRVIIYGKANGEIGTLVDYSGQHRHAKHSTVTTKGLGCSDYVIPVGYTHAGVSVPSDILQRAMREYKNLSKRIIITGNRHYVHFQTDGRFSLHRSDNLFGSVIEEKDAVTADVSVELSIGTLSRIQKITQFNSSIHITCDTGLPIRFTTEIGPRGSHIDIFLEEEGHIKK